MAEYVNKSMLYSLCEPRGIVTLHVSDIDAMHSENVAQVVYGKWIIPHWKNSTHCAYCSVCGEEAQHGEYNGVQKHYKLCPVCGAKMCIRKDEDRV